MKETDASEWRQIVKQLLDAGAYYDIQSAIYLNDVERVRVVLSDNTRLANGPHGAQNVPLRVAAREGHVEICNLLLHHKADPDDLEYGGGIPILCDAVDHPPVVKLLLDAGADSKARVTWRGWRTGQWFIKDDATVLHYAARSGVVATATLLLTEGVDINATDQDGHTSLHIAAMFARPEMVRCLLNRSASISTNDDGKTPLGIVGSGPYGYPVSNGPEQEILETERILREASRRRVTEEGN